MQLPISAQPSLKAALSYPVLGALPFTCRDSIAASADLEVAAVAGDPAIELQISTAISSAPIPGLAVFFNLQNLNDSVDECVNLALDVSAALGSKNGSANDI